MSLYEVTELDEAMNAIKEEMLKDRTESLLQEKNNVEYNLESIEFS